MSMAAADTARAADTDDGSSQSARAQLQLRELILGGTLKPGTRIAELAMVERLGMSRTPIRMALVRLEEEGLLEVLPSGGFAVRDFSEGDIHDAIELRGCLEGLAARFAAERDVPAAVMAEARDCVERIDVVLASPTLDDASFAAYVEQNGRFHALLAEMSGSTIVARQIERTVTLPFASANAFVMMQATGTRARDRLLVAHDQHHAVLEAIGRGEAGRAEALMQEHARHARHNLDDALRNHQTLQRLPGASLIRRRTTR